jgi:hypothetical protein
MTRSFRLIAFSALAALAAGSACAGSLQSPEEIAADEAKFAAAQAHAGEPRETVRFLRPIHRYEVIAEHAVLVWETPAKAWLVDLRESEACRDLERTIAIGVDTMNDTLNTSNGYFVGEYGVRCKMEQIREVDVPAMRQALREAGNSTY